MTDADRTAPPARVLAKQDFDALLGALRARGYEVLGPTLAEGAIVYGPLNAAADLPRGWTDRQEPGRYRLERRDDDAWFGYVVGPHSWKRYLFPPHVSLCVSRRTATGWETELATPEVKRYAFVGVRACELAAIAVQDRVFQGSAYQDPHYVARRREALLVAVNCTQAAETCFCTSMGTGPRATAGFDLGLTELPEAFVVETGSPRGAEVLAELPTRPASDSDLSTSAAARQQAVTQITRRLDAERAPELLMSNLNHPRWQQVAERCLSCANCTLVCPTCFCSGVNELGDLEGQSAERVRTWDSCFHPQLSYLNGGLVRNDIRARYRQWLTHKLATWHEQFGSSGCVGCGRCITWCPVGIDLTEEVAALAESTR
ncbi:MAG: 4Fe-4S dicluster domain-containing protein [Pirellulales bacterium]|nr:4Fe-4S dicluster domain-containing protein [Pirellulales bacterium]